MKYIVTYAREYIRAVIKPKQLQWPITINVNNETNQSNIRNWRQARENACDQVAIGFGFTSDWLSRWRELFKPITERRTKANSRLTFDTQLKTTLPPIQIASFSTIIF